jgi:flagellar biosynthesis/type III secretory pathway protein FliH
MREQLNLRQKDIDWGRREGKTEGITEGIAKGTAKGMNAAKRMLQDGKINQEQLEDFLKYMEEEDEKNDLHFRQLTA